MNKINKKIALIIIILSSSCEQKSDYIRDVFLGIKLGVTVSESKKIFNSLVENNKIIKSSQGNYATRNILQNKEYYLVPIVYNKDSIIVGLDLLIADDRKEIPELLRSKDLNSALLNLEIDQEQSQISLFEIEKDIVSEINKKYGNTDIMDSATNLITTMGLGMLNTSYYKQWTDKNGLDINLTKTLVTTEYGISGNLILSYRYNKKAYDKLPIRKNDF